MLHVFLALRKNISCLSRCKYLLVVVVVVFVLGNGVVRCILVIVFVVVEIVAVVRVVVCAFISQVFYRHDFWFSVNLTSASHDFVCGAAMSKPPR